MTAIAARAAPEARRNELPWLRPGRGFLHQVKRGQGHPAGVFMDRGDRKLRHQVKRRVRATAARLTTPVRSAPHIRSTTVTTPGHSFRVAWLVRS